VRARDYENPWRPNHEALAVALWLGLGAIAVAGAGRAAALHVVTVGALGTLTLNVMGAAMLRQMRRDPADEPLLVWGTVGMGGATVARIAAALAPAFRTELLLVSAACWTAAFLALSWLMARCLLVPRRRREHEQSA
jgi:uncharacterized protein involved in response to NO